MIGVFAVMAWVGYLIALVALFYGATISPGQSKTPLCFLATAMALMVFVSTSNSFQHLGITAALDPFEDYAEILFVPLVAYGLYGYFVTSQGGHIDSARAIAESEHHMLLEIVEHTPVGIAIVDVGGRIGYANPMARELLQLKDDPTCLDFTSPGKVWRADATQEPEGILTVDPGLSLESAPYVFKTADAQIPLLLSVTPLHPESPQGASVVTIRRAGES